MGFVPEHNEADTAIKQAARTFGFPVHVRVILFDVGLPQTFNLSKTVSVN